MTKRRLWLVVLGLVLSICAGICLVACGGTNGGGNDGEETEPVALTAPAVTIDAYGKASWSEAEHASGYAFKIDDGAEQTATALTVQLTDGQSVAVKAKGDGVNYADSNFSAAKTYRAPAANLSAPENLTAQIQGVDEGKVLLSWNAVEGASGYEYIATVDNKQSTATAAETTVTVNLSEINSARLDATWVFEVRALGNMEEIANDGDYSGHHGSSGYSRTEFSIDNGELYTVEELLPIMNYYGTHLPSREFMVAGTIASNANGDAMLENGFTLFGKYVPELYLAIDGRLQGLEVTAIGTLKKEGEVRGLSSYRSVDFENIADDDRYALVKDTLNAWDMLEYESQIMGDFYLPVELYGVNIDWEVDDDDTGAFALDEYGNVTITCPAAGEEDIYVGLTATLYLGNDIDDIYEEELEYLVVITADTRTPLDAPKININPKTGVATWTAIEHATGYYVTYYGFSVPGDYYSEYVNEEIVIPADGNRSVQLKDTWWITVQALGDSKTYSNSDIASKQYNYYPETVEPDGTPLEFDLTKLTQTGTLSNPDYIFGLACGNASVFESASATKVELGNSDSNGVMQGTGFIKVGSANNDGKITLNFNKKILGVVITARQWNENQNDKVSVNGSEEQTASKNDWGIMYFNFTAAKASTKVEINTNNRVFIEKITVYVAD
ncbi:MAG: hypothetical protein K2G44_07000 [Clostridia bacterium]|nr:hypothetical protein [Clostridia bacterium]